MNVIDPAESSPMKPVRVAGRLSLDGGGDHPCQADITSPERVVITAAEPGRGGEAVLCRLDGIGLIAGHVASPTGTGFTLIPDLCEARRDRVAARLMWLRNGIDQRAAPRIVPLHRTVVIRSAHDMIAEGEIDDLSKSGARIRLLSPPASHRLWMQGLPVAVGKRFSVIVRTEPGRIAVRFHLPFSDETFNPSVIL